MSYQPPHPHGEDRRRFERQMRAIDEQYRTWSEPDDCRIELISHCVWAVDPDGRVEVILGEDLSIEDGQRLWLRRRRGTIAFDMYPGYYLELDDWMDVAGEIHCRIESGAFEGVVVGPLHGWDEVRQYHVALVDCGAIDDRRDDNRSLVELEPDESTAGAVAPWRLLLEYSDHAVVDRVASAAATAQAQ